MMRALVTGATGILGSHVVLQLLEKNYDVVATKQNTSNLNEVKKLFSYYQKEYLFEKINWVEIDLNEQFSIEQNLENIQEVYHCAGYVSFNRFHKNKLLQVNFEGTRNVVNACIAKKIKTLCYVSSLAVFHNLDHKEKINEAVFWKQSGKESDYAFSKYKAELEVLRGAEEGLNTVIVNPGVILSPYFWKQSSSQLFSNASKGKLFYPPGQTAYVAASDVAKAMLMLVEREIFNQRFILIEDNYSFKTILSRIQNANGKKPPSIILPPFVLYLAWIADSFLSFLINKKPVLTKAVINSTLNKQAYSNEKIKSTLNFQFIPCLSLIDEICAEYKKEYS